MSRTRGFTLLELLVAIAILAVALVGVMQAVTQGINSSIISRDRARAVELAEMKLTELRLDPTLEPGTQEDEFDDLQPGWRWTSDVSETELEGLLRIQVTVSWEQGGHSRSVEIETCFAPDALVDPTAELSASDAASAGLPAAGTDPGGGGGPAGAAQPSP